MCVCYFFICILENARKWWRHEIYSNGIISGDEFGLEFDARRSSTLIIYVNCAFFRLTLVSAALNFPSAKTAIQQIAQKYPNNDTNSD